ncbi:MAG TPA: prenyltransferase/squalene oxidase repeat-containing protein [Candidatus Saccharimonadales bacterium]|nr:prenyltransferase/squalene oxidase repeat-containing protein [Candidatus Saccharimonadales bacterium]
MSIRLEMLQVARVAPKILGDATALVRDFLLSQQNPDGGFKDRLGRSDLYYTVFGLNSLIALQAELDLSKSASYLRGFGIGEKLDFIHLCCLARCWAALTTMDSKCRVPEQFPGFAVGKIEAHRSRDGGYFIVPGGTNGTAYTSFLALGSYQDLGRDVPDPLRLIQSFKFLETPDGAWSNDRHMKIGATNATAAAVTALRHLGAPLNTDAGNWLLARAHPQGGFLATPDAPIPDLLSTATALHALAGLQVSFELVKESCLDFIDSLWTNEGSFHGHWSEDILDTEYTFYGLLALGHLYF